MNELTKTPELPENEIEFERLKRAFRDEYNIDFDISQDRNNIDGDTLKAYGEIMSFLCKNINSILLEREVAFSLRNMDLIVKGVTGDIKKSVVDKIKKDNL